LGFGVAQPDNRRKADMIKPREPSAVERDIVVTPLGRQYAIGRLNPDAKTQSLIETQPDLYKALTRACELAGDDHRVFVAHAQRHTTALVDCTDLARQTPRTKNN
jgi:hypothetical protein